MPSQTDSSPKIHHVAAGRYSITSHPSPLWKTFPPGTRLRDLEGQTTISFPAESVFSFKDYLVRFQGSLPYHEAATLFHSLSDQLKTLSSLHGHYVPFYSPQDVIVIDGRGYVARPEVLFVVEDEQNSYPESLSNVPFIPPEIKATGPPIVTPACSLYTMASLVGASMFPKWSQHMSAEEIAATLSEIVTTPLYWAILRCTATRPTDRVILYI